MTFKQEQKVLSIIAILSIIFLFIGFGVAEYKEFGVPIAVVAFFILITTFIGGIAKKPPKLSCGKCSVEIKNGDVFCKNCGTKLGESGEILCNNCNTKLNPNDKFCPKCGEATSVKISINQTEQQFNKQQTGNSLDVSSIFRFKKIYIIWFLVLITPPILTKIYFYLTNGYLFTEETSFVLTIITKVVLMILTFWYAFKIKVKDIWAIILGISTLIPFIAWISFIILLVATDKKIKSINKKL